MPRIHELRDAKAAKYQELRALDELANAEARDLSAEEQVRFDAGMAECARLGAAIEREEALMEGERSLEGIEIGAAAIASDPVPEAAKEGRFNSLGEMLQAVAHADGEYSTRDEWDARLKDLFVPSKGYEAASGASGANESTPSEGGFAVQTDHASGILEMAHDAGQLLSRVRRIPLSTNANGVKILGVDESSRADGQRWGGVRTYWANEAATVADSKPKYREIELRLNKLMGIGYTTDELLSDAAALDSVMRRAFAEEIEFKTEEGIFAGTGAGQMLGFINSGALITVEKEGGQAAGTITTPNILNMWSRMPARLRRSAVWFVNQDVETQLYQLTLGGGAGMVLLYRPPGVEGPNVNSPFGTLFGRPVIPIEHAATLGTAGDITLMDPSQYLMIDKNGVQADTSMHVRFLYNEMTFRITYRVDGQPAWRLPLMPKNGANTHSPYIALQTRD